MRVYQVVFDYVDEFILPLGDKKVVRPFFPGGDYQKDADSYDDHTVVIDNPPFSINTEVCRFYIDRSIKFFLFSPHLTAFNTRPTKHSIIITNADVVYENGAKIRTAFTTNLLGDVLIKVAPDLARRIKAAQEAEEKECLPKYVYPSNLVTVSSISRLVNSGVEFEVMRSEAHFVHTLDDQRAHKKKIFGGGFLVSDSVVNSINSINSIEKLNPAKCEYVWRLSERERNLISCLSDAREIDGY